MTYLPLFRKILFFILFVLFIVPYSINIGGQGVSVNYLFALFPLLLLMYKGKFNWPKGRIVVFMIIFVCIYVASLLYQFENNENIIRQLASFILFMTLFAFLFVKIDLDMIYAFKGAVVFYSTYSSLTILYLFFDLGGNELGSYAKGLVGSQRIGFVYILALWMMVFYRVNTPLLIILKHSIIVIIIAGLLLTFSRSSVAALFFSTAVYFSLITIKFIKKEVSFYSFVHKIFLSIVYIIGLAILANTILPVTINAYEKTIYNYITSSVEESKSNKEMNDYIDPYKDIEQAVINKDIEQAVINKDDSENRVIYDMKNKNTSVGYRYYMSKIVLDYAINNPFTGSGYIGVWNLFENREGSAHSQYLDVLFRVGFLGFFVYMFILFKILGFLYKQDTGVLIGFAGILIYGLFHETFKLSQGAFILAFLLAMYEQRNYLFKKDKGQDT